jgi:hypothetical protein
MAEGDGHRMRSNQRLFQFAVAVSVLNVVAAVVAIIVNWPAQFGGVGTDAGREFLTSGTAISAPVLPAVLLLFVVWRARTPGPRGRVAIVAAYLTAAVVFTGGLGETLAEPTEDTPKAVLVGAGIGWTVIAAALVFLATAARAERRRLPSEPGTD